MPKVKQSNSQFSILNFQFRSRAGAVLVGIGIVVIVFSQLFDVRVDSSERARNLRRILGVRRESAVDGGVPISYGELVERVSPSAGKEVLVRWGDIGKTLVSVGAIDLEKFKARYGGLSSEQQQVLNGSDLSEIKFTSENIQFWTNVLWALGLTQRSRVLTNGLMMQNKLKTPIENYASTAGWTLGTKSANQLYGSVDITGLTAEQDELVYRVAENIYRPCCGNSTAYPDCNHGMAVLGLITLMASQGASEDEMYKAALTFNSYAFTGTYVTTAAYFAKGGIDWESADPKEILSQTYSGAQGSGFIARAVGEIAGAPKKGASCGA